jgi:hypothetical protein
VPSLLPYAAVSTALSDAQEEGLLTIDLENDPFAKELYAMYILLLQEEDGYDELAEEAYDHWKDLYGEDGAV